MCSLRDAAEQLAQLGARTLGISLDDVAAQAAFAKAQELVFPLLSDPDGSAAAKYHAMMDGRPLSRRVTFVIDDEGQLRHVDDAVKVDSHGTDLVGLLRELMR